MHLKTLRVLVICVVIGGVTASLAIRYRAQNKLREGEEVLHQQSDELARLTTEYQRLSNLAAQASNTTAKNQTAELEKLRSESKSLQKQTNAPGKQLAEHRRSRQLPNDPPPNIRSSGGLGYVVSDSSSEEYKQQLYKTGTASRPWTDAQNLAEAVRTYAREHQGEFPTTFDQAAAYFFKNYPPPQISEFEMVYQGSLNELTNIPQQAVALIRERNPWPTPAGKLARFYYMANGFFRIVESDDNFQSWENAHIIPPRTK